MLASRSLRLAHPTTTLRGVNHGIRHLSTTRSSYSINNEVTHPESRANPPQTVLAHLQGPNRYLLQVYDRPPIVFERAEGMYIWDSEGRKYLDFSAGIAVNSLGHCDEGVAEVLKKQSKTLMHASNVYHTPYPGRLAQKLVNLTKKHGGLGFEPSTEVETKATEGENVGVQVFFSNSGTEANEGALKIAKKVGKERWAMKNKGRSWDASLDGVGKGEACTKNGIVCFENGFHGRSMGSLSVTWNLKYQGPFQPLIPNVSVGRFNDMSSLELVGEDTCAVIVEPIQGEGGVHSADEMFLRSLRKRCDAMGAVLIYDEIQSGLFRTGEMWAHGGLPKDCHPDMITVAKALGNGYPIGAVLMREEVGKVMGYGSHGTTFGGSALACAVGEHVLGRLDELKRNVQEMGEYLNQKLEEMAKENPDIILGIRGRGLIRGIVVSEPGQIVKRSREKGVLLLSAGSDAVRLLPSLNVTRQNIDVAVAAIANSLRP